MDKQNLKSLAILILSISIVISSIFVSNSIKGIYNNDKYLKMKTLETLAEKGFSELTALEILDEDKVLTLEEAAKYLKISTEELKHSIGRTKTEIPHIKMGGKYIFTEKGLYNWVKYSEYHK